MDHILSFVLFIVMIIEFIAVPRAATSTFLILLALSFVDVIGGFTITIRTAQRDIAVDRPEHMAPRTPEPSLQRNLDRRSAARSLARGGVERGGMAGGRRGGAPRLRRALGGGDELGEEGGRRPRMVTRARTRARAACGPVNRHQAASASLMVNPR